MARIRLLLNFHAEDVCVHGQGDLVCHDFDLSLLALNGAPHLIQPLVERLLDVFARLNLLAQAGLEGRSLLAHLLIVLLEVAVQHLKLLFLSMRGLKVAFHSLECPLEVLVFLTELLDFHI